MTRWTSGAPVPSDPESIKQTLVKMLEDPDKPEEITDRWGEINLESYDIDGHACRMGMQVPMVAGPDLQLSLGDALLITIGAILPIREANSIQWCADGHPVASTVDEHGQWIVYHYDGEMIVTPDPDDPVQMSILNGLVTDGDLEASPRVRMLKAIVPDMSELALKVTLAVGAITHTFGSVLGYGLAPMYMEFTNSQDRSVVNTCVWAMANNIQN